MGRHKRIVVALVVSVVLGGLGAFAAQSAWSASAQQDASPVGLWMSPSLQHSPTGRAERQQMKETIFVVRPADLRLVPLPLGSSALKPRVHAAQKEAGR